MDVFNSIFDAIKQILGILEIDLNLGGLEEKINGIIEVIEGIKF